MSYKTVDLNFPLGGYVRKILVSVKFLSAILGPEMAAPILWTPGKMRPFCRKSHVHKIPRFFGGGGILGFWGGECRFIFMGTRIFLILGMIDPLPQGAATRVGKRSLRTFAPLLCIVMVYVSSLCSLPPPSLCICLEFRCCRLLLPNLVFMVFRA